eukprot:gene16772-23048_t
MTELPTALCRKVGGRAQRSHPVAHGVAAAVATGDRAQLFRIPDPVRLIEDGRTTDRTGRPDTAGNRSTEPISSDSHPRTHTEQRASPKNPSQPPPPQVLTEAVNVIVTAPDALYLLECWGPEVVLAGILGVYVEPLYIQTSPVECTSIHQQIILRFYVLDMQAANVVVDILAQRVYGVLMASGAPCNSFVLISTEDKAFSATCHTEQEEGNTPAYKQKSLACCIGACDSRYCCAPPPPPSHYFQSPPPPTHYFQSPPPPTHYFRSPPPPTHYFRSPPPPTHYYRSPPPPYHYYRSPPPPNNMHRLYRGITVKVPIDVNGMCITPEYVAQFLCPSLLHSLITALAASGQHRDVDYTVQEPCIVNPHVTSSAIYYKLEFYMSDQAWICLFSALAYPDQFSVIVYNANIICGSSFRVYDAPPKSSIIVYNDKHNHLTSDEHYVAQFMCGDHASPALVDH